MQVFEMMAVKTDAEGTVTEILVNTTTVLAKDKNAANNKFLVEQHDTLGDLDMNLVRIHSRCFRGE